MKTLNVYYFASMQIKHIIWYYHRAIPTFYQLRNSSWCNLIFCSTMVMSIFYLVNDSHKHVPMAIFSFRDYRLRILNQILKYKWNKKTTLIVEIHKTIKLYIFVILKFKRSSERHHPICTRTLKWLVWKDQGSFQ